MAGPGPGRMGPMGFLTDEEKQNKPKVSKALLARIMSYLKPYWLQLVFVFIAILLSATVGLLPSIITGRIVDEALVGKEYGASDKAPGCRICRTYREPACGRR